MNFEFLMSFLAGLALGAITVYWFASRIYRTLEIERIQQRQNDRDLRGYMEVLRREVGNYLMSRSPEILLSAYDEISAYEESIRSRTDSFRKKEKEELSEKYKLYTDFDIVETRHFIPYSDAFAVFNDGEVLAHYLDLSKWLCLTIEPGRNQVTSSRERSILIDQIGRIKNRNFRCKIERVMDLFFHYCSGRDEASIQFEDEEYRVKRLPISSPSDDYGIEIKASNEFSIYEQFTNDSDKTFKSIYRSNGSFEEREPLL